MAILVPSMIEIREDGRVMVAGTGFKVRMIAEVVKYQGWSAQEIAEAYDGITLAQVHAALSCYYDHKEEIDAQIAAGERMEKEYFEAHPEATLLTSKLRDRGVVA